jgi:hypothetical protein
MKARRLKHRAPRPQPYTIGVSVRVPEYEGPMGWPMDSVRLYIRSSSQSGGASHTTCMRHITAARERYIADHCTPAPTSPQGVKEGE